MRLSKFYPLRCSNGNALLELALIIPVVLIILSGTFELTDMLRGYQLMQAIVKEAGRQAYRECSQLGTDVCPGGVSKTDRCLIDIRTQFLAIAQAGRLSFATIFDDIDLTLTTYRLQDVAGVPTIVRVGVAESATCAALNTCSRYSEAGMRNNAELNALITAKQSLTVAEFYGTYSSILRLFLPGDFAGGQYYVRVMY